MTKTKQLDILIHFNDFYFNPISLLSVNTFHMMSLEKKMIVSFSFT